LRIDWLVVTTTQRPGEEKREKADQTANHNLSTLLAIPLLLAERHAHAIGKGLKRQRQRIMRLVVEEAIRAVPNLHNDALVTFQRLRQRVALIPGVEQVLCEPVRVNVTTIDPLFHDASVISRFH
jgi:hypothetical protein